MDAWPFTPEDWERLKEPCLGMVNASYAKDEVLRASLIEELRSIVAEYRDKYGPHPILPEIEADFTEEPSERVVLYEEAVRFALAEGLITFTIRISLAGVLLEDLNDAAKALTELLACREELPERADEYERKEWQEYYEECRKRLPKWPSASHPLQ